MINTLFLPELREMLAEQNLEELAGFCVALHPSRTAMFMEGLSDDEVWQVLKHADSERVADIFSYFNRDRQLDLVTTERLSQAAELIRFLPSDDRVDLLQGVDDDVRSSLLDLLPVEDRRDIMRLSQYPEGTAGAVMTTEMAMLRENLSIREAMDEIGRQSEDYETIYYLYIVDDQERLQGLVSARQLLSRMKSPQTKLSDIMETDLVTALVMEDQEEVAEKVARLDLLAIPVVDPSRRLAGIITHDDIIDVFREEATEDAHRSAAMEPLAESYLRTSLLTLSWKRGVWLAILFFCALLTAFALERYEKITEEIQWLILFIPLIISSGGNSGSQSATLIITALSRDHIKLTDWATVIRRELVMGVLLGLGLAALGGLASLFLVPQQQQLENWMSVLVVPITLVLVVISGTLSGSVLPLIFERIGWDPAIMSNPFVAGIVDILGIVIYMTVAVGLVGVAG
jgi:magnesium transporter